MRKNLGAKSALYPMPVLMIGTYNDDGSPNLMNAAWGGISDTNEIGICLASHRTTDNLLKRKAFTVSVAVERCVKECDFVGLVSANKDADKFKKTGFHALKSEFVDAPLFEELPYTLECELISYEPGSGHLFGKIINVSIDEAIMKNETIDINQFKPLVFDDLNHCYRTIGEEVAKAFDIGNSLKQSFPSIF